MASVRRRVGWIGLLQAGRRQPSPWRWQAQQTFRNTRPTQASRVLLPASFWHRLAEADPKVAWHCPPAEWAVPDLALPPRTPERVQAIRQMHALSLSAGERQECEALVRALVKTDGLQITEVRQLIARLRYGDARAPARHTPHRPRPLRV